MIILTDDDRVIYELDLGRLDCRDGTLTISVGSENQHQRCCQRGSRVSNNGLRAVIFYIQCCTSTETSTYNHGEEQWTPAGPLQTRIELVFVELDGTFEQVRRVELQYRDPYPSTTHDHVINLSPDLSLLQAGLHIFDLSTPGYRRLFSPDFPLSNIREMRESSVSFSSCNDYLTVIKCADSLPKGQKVTLELFRISRSARSIKKIVLADLEGFMADYIFAAFHPVLPLLMVTFLDYDAEGSWRLVKVIENDLEALKTIPVEHQPHDRILAAR